MPIKLRDQNRSRTIAAHRANDFGADRPFLTSGEYEPKENCEFYTQKLRRLGFCDDLQINVEPLTRSIPSLSQNVEHLMKKFSYWWAGKNRAWVVELHGPDLEPCWFQDRGWLGYFAAVAPIQEDHGSHAHIVVNEQLTAWDELMLAKLGERLDMRVNVSRNSEGWLRKKRLKNPNQQHTCRIEYTVDHLRRKGSVFIMYDFYSPEWVRRSKVARSKSRAGHVGCSATT